MADDTPKKQTAGPPPAPLTPANVAPSPSAEGVPGGRYIVNGVAVDSEGRPLDAPGQPADKEG
jgi:hypothetical protein